MTGSGLYIELAKHFQSKLLTRDPGGRSMTEAYFVHLGLGNLRSGPLLFSSSPFPLGKKKKKKKNS